MKIDITPEQMITKMVKSVQGGRVGIIYMPRKYIGKTVVILDENPNDAPATPE